MNADVAFAERAEKRVDNGVQEHVGVGVPGKSGAVRDLDAAQHELARPLKPVRIESVADAEIGSHKKNFRFRIDHRANAADMQMRARIQPRISATMSSMWLVKWILFCLAAIPLLMIVTGRISLGQDYRTANRDSAGIAPDPKATREAVVQVYAARALNWRGIFGVHTWIVTKPENADEFTIH